MKNKFRNLPLQGKISSVYILANFVVFAVNIILLWGINGMSRDMDMVYQENLRLNELADALENVHDSMTDYLNVKTSDSLEEFYLSEQAYTQMVGELNDTISEATFGRMERNIKHLSEEYLEIVGQAIEAKRGRNVEKYRMRYEEAVLIYDYLDTYIQSLNTERFKSNSENYNKLSEDFSRFEILSILILAGAIIGNVAAIVKLTGTIIKPLKVLAVSADEVANGNFNIELLEVSAKDEIGAVTGAFNQMVISIRQYIQKLRQSMEKEMMMETHLKDAQLKYLQAQINPHFLFNTLNAGAQLAMMEEADRTYEYVQKMADFFRYNVKKSNETVRLREEIELVDNYIYILNVRFSGDIHYEKNVDSALLDVKMPSMVLQPIVENCVNHGIREMEGRGKIRLSVYRKEEVVCISVRDNGIGMSEDTQKEILSGVYRERKGAAGANGIGMDNVIARIRLFSECEDVITINSAGENQGTEVILYLRIKEEEDV